MREIFSVWAGVRSRSVRNFWRTVSLDAGGPERCKMSWRPNFMDTAPVAAPARNTSRRVEKMRGFCQVARGAAAAESAPDMLLLPIGDEIEEHGVFIGEAGLSDRRTSRLGRCGETFGGDQ